MFGFGKLKKPKSIRQENSSLNHARKGLDYKIVQFETNKGLSQKLMVIGLPIGSCVQILQHRPGGGAIIAKGNLRIALGSALAAQVTVFPL